MRLNHWISSGWNMSSKIYRSYFDSPLGVIELTSDGAGITSLTFRQKALEAEQPLELLDRCKRELAAYFRGELFEFSLPLSLEGTPFQREVWEALRKIPYGETRSYGDIARLVGNPGALRAVGGANNKNKIAIIIPCHRVVGSRGKLTGYAGGLERKEWLLKHENYFFSGRSIR